MVVKFDSPTKTASGTLNNTGSSSAFVGYLGKEDSERIEQGEQPEQWFSHDREEVSPAEVRITIDSDHQGIGKTEGKFATGSINLTAEEWQTLGRTEEERAQNLKGWIKEDFAQEFTDNFDKKNSKGERIGIEPDNVKMFFKLEHTREFKGTDEEVKQGEKEQGEKKEGFNVHCHFIIARKTADGQSRISPTTNNRKEFDRNALIERTEKSFDQRTGYERPLEQSYSYAKTMANGTGEEKAELIRRTAEQNQHQHPQAVQPAQEQPRTLDRPQEVKQAQEKPREQDKTQEQGREISRDFGMNTM